MTDLYWRIQKYKRASRDELLDKEKEEKTASEAQNDKPWVVQQVVEQNTQHVKNTQTVQSAQLAPNVTYEAAATTDTVANVNTVQTYSTGNVGDDPTWAMTIGEVQQYGEIFAFLMIHPAHPHSQVLLCYAIACLGRR